MHHIIIFLRYCRKLDLEILEHHLLVIAQSWNRGEGQNSTCSIDLLVGRPTHQLVNKRRVKGRVKSKI